MNKETGAKLRQAREARSLSLEQISQSIHIRPHYLRAMEEGDFQSIPSSVQAKGFLRAYADFLGLDAQTLLTNLEDNPKGETKRETPASKEIPEAPPVAPTAAQAFAEIGKALSEQRHLLGLSLEDVERHTFLKTGYLHALEAGRIEDLPSPVQARGMLKNYASFLGMEPEKVLLRFAEGLQAELIARHPERLEGSKRKKTTRPRPPSRVRRLFSTETMIGGSLIGALVFFMLWSAIRFFASQTESTITPTSLSIVDVLLATATPTLSPTPEPVTPTIPSALLPPVTEATPIVPVDNESGAENSGESIQVNIQVNQRTWMRVIVDGEVEFEGRVLAGEAYTFNGEKQIEILTGNGAALYVTFNQQVYGLMGTFGQVANKIFAANGAFNPTPTLSPTPTETLPPTATPRTTATETNPAPALP